jgi:hypothetical protein
MGFTQQFYDAGHKYGLDNMAVTPAQVIKFQGILGQPTGDTNSWGNSDPLIGQPLSSSVTFSSGVTATAAFTLTSYTTVAIASVSYTRTDTKELIYAAVGSASISASNFGDALQDWYLFSGADILNGNSYDNVLKGYTGNDRIDGGPGTDTAYFSGFKSKYQITKSGTAISVSGPDGADTLLNVERLHFDDFTLAFDLNSNAGQAYRLYQAALNRTPDKVGLGAQIGGLDSGMSLLQIAQNFMDSAEFKMKYGANLSNSGFVTQLYSNVLHRAPDASGYAHQVGALDSAAASRAQLLVNFSESPENQAALIGVIQNGIEYQA